MVLLYFSWLRHSLRLGMVTAMKIKTYSDYALTEYKTYTLVIA